MNKHLFFSYFYSINLYFEISPFNEFTNILLSETHQRPSCLIGDPSETSTCVIGDQHAWSKTHRRPWHPKLETDMPDRRLIKDRHAPSVTDIPHRRLTSLIRYPSVTSTCFIMVTHLKPTFSIGDPSETDMPRRRPIWNRHAQSETHWRPTCLSVSYEECRGLR